MNNVRGSFTTTSSLGCKSVPSGELSKRGQSTSYVAIVHDYLTQRGGAERVVISMSQAFPGAPVYASFYDKHTTFPEFGECDVAHFGSI